MSTGSSLGPIVVLDNPAAVESFLKGTGYAPEAEQKVRRSRKPQPRLSDQDREQIAKQLPRDAILSLADAICALSSVTGLPVHLVANAAGGILHAECASRC